MGRAAAGGGMLALLVAAAPLPAGRATLGQYDGWGAFRDRAPARCYAIAEPVGGRTDEAFVTVASWPGAGVRSQVTIRLRKPAITAMAILGDMRLALAVHDRDASPADAAGGRRLVARLRDGGVLEIAARDAAGRRIRDRYVLAGAASAIDAMRLACLPA